MKHETRGWAPMGRTDSSISFSSQLLRVSSTSNRAEPERNKRGEDGLTGLGEAEILEKILEIIRS